MSAPDVVIRAFASAASVVLLVISRILETWKPVIFRVCVPDLLRFRPGDPRDYDEDEAEDADRRRRFVPRLFPQHGRRSLAGGLFRHRCRYPDH